MELLFVKHLSQIVRLFAEASAFGMAHACAHPRFTHISERLRNHARHVPPRTIGPSRHASSEFAQIQCSTL